MYCNKCGHNNDGNAQFCGNCGASLNNVAQSENQQQTQQRNVQKHSSKKKKSALLWIIGICVVVLGGIVFVFSSLTTPKEKPMNEKLFEALQNFNQGRSAYKQFRECFDKIVDEKEIRNFFNETIEDGRRHGVVWANISIIDTLSIDFQKNGKDISSNALILNIENSTTDYTSLTIYYLLLDNEYKIIGIADNWSRNPNSDIPYDRIKSSLNEFIEFYNDSFEDYIILD
ncbi:MAG: zinc ribbon domain-containing protein [Bacteroidales bacterium]|jgi:hypothetical protein|nr:zinc ribbon domain-containing protein [Bacteroidales bacterium]